MAKTKIGNDGAGRPTLYDSRMSGHTITMPDAQWLFVEKRGGAAYIRQLVESAMQNPKNWPMPAALIGKRINLRELDTLVQTGEISPGAWVVVWDSVEDVQVDGRSDFGYGWDEETGYKPHGSYQVLAETDKWNDQDEWLLGHILPEYQAHCVNLATQILWSARNYAENGGA